MEKWDGKFIKISFHWQFETDGAILLRERANLEADQPWTHRTSKALNLGS